MSNLTTLNVKGPLVACYFRQNEAPEEWASGQCRPWVHPIGNTIDNKYVELAVHHMAFVYVGNLHLSTNLPYPLWPPNEDGSAVSVTDMRQWLLETAIPLVQMGGRTLLGYLSERFKNTINIPESLQFPTAALEWAVLFHDVKRHPDIVEGIQILVIGGLLMDHKCSALKQLDRKMLLASLEVRAREAATADEQCELHHIALIRRLFGFPQHLCKAFKQAYNFADNLRLCGRLYKIQGSDSDWEFDLLDSIFQKGETSTKAAKHFELLNSMSAFHQQSLEVIPEIVRKLAYGILLPTSTLEDIPKTLSMYLSLQHAEDLERFMHKTQDNQIFANLDTKYGVRVFLIWSLSSASHNEEIRRWTRSDDAKRELEKLREVARYRQTAPDFVGILFAVLGYSRLQSPVQPVSTMVDDGTSLVSVINGFLEGQDMIPPNFEKVFSCLKEVMETLLIDGPLEYFQGVFETCSLQPSKFDEELEQYFYRRMQGHDHQDALELARGTK